MILDEELQAAYETFEGDVRKLDELVGQLELWSDECTINHKKEEVRLPQYIELHLNLEELKAQLEEEVKSLESEEGLKEKLEEAKAQIKERLASYQETEEVIHNWVREIKNIYVVVNHSKVLEDNKAYIKAILEQA